MATRKLTDYQQTKAKEIIAKIILRKGTQEKAAEEIEKQLGIRISRQQVSYHVKALQQEWLANSQRDIATIKAEEIAELDNLKNEVYNEWERSKLNAETTTTKLVGIDEAKSNKAKQHSVFIDDEAEDPRNPKLQVQTEETKKVAGQSGDPRYITNLLNIQERKAKLLGLDAPTKLQAEFSNKDPKQMTDDELIAEHARLQEALGFKTGNN